MNTGDHGDVQAQAAQWHACVLGGGDLDWDAFGRWLDADPEHQAAYDRLALLEDDFTNWARDHAPAEEEATEEEPEAPPQPARQVHPRRMWMVGSAIAAVLAGILVIPVASSWLHPTVYYNAQDGQRQIALAGGTRMRLDRGTRIAVDTGSTQHVEVIAGAVYFDVGHGDANSGPIPLEVEAGDYTIRDIGTRFAVSRRDAEASVGVEQGLVDVSWPGHAAVRLSQGQLFDATGQGSGVEIRSVDPASVAGWREGRLVYDNAPLSLVVADISRYSAEPVYADASVADLKLSGVLLVKNGSDLVQQIEAYLPVHAHREDGLVRFTGKPGTP